MNKFITLALCALLATMAYGQVIGTYPNVFLNNQQNGGSSSSSSSSASASSQSATASSNNGTNNGAVMLLVPATLVPTPVDRVSIPVAAVSPTATQGLGLTTGPSGVGASGSGVGILPVVGGSGIGASAPCDSNERITQ